MNHSSPEFSCLLKILASVVRPFDSPPFDSNVSSRSLFELARTHGVVNMIADGLTKFASPLPEKARDAFSLEKDMAIYREAVRQVELEQIFKDWEDLRIRFMPLKGYVMKGLYPSQEMRTMTDVDILIDRNSLTPVAKVLKKYGYQFLTTGVYHDVFCKAKFLTIEIHYDLFPADNYFQRAFLQIWDRAKPKSEGSFHYIMDDEDFYCHLLAHLTFHYLYNGVTIRYILDVWIFHLKRRNNVDWNRIESRLQSMKIDVFAENIVRLTKVWFEAAPSNDICDQTTDYILLFDTPRMEKIVAANKILVNLHTFSENRASRFKYMISRLFPPVAVYKKRYPILRKYSFLIVVFWICKCFNMIFYYRSFDVLKNLLTTSRKDLKKLKQFHHNSGL